MRIQETDRILKDARVARHGAQQHEQGNVLSRAWRKLTALFKRD
jgi:hypothetical protein